MYISCCLLLTPSGCDQLLIGSQAVGLQKWKHWLALLFIYLKVHHDFVVSLSYVTRPQDETDVTGANDDIMHLANRAHLSLGFLKQCCFHKKSFQLNAKESVLEQQCYRNNYLGGAHMPSNGLENTSILYSFKETHINKGKAT